MSTTPAPHPVARFPIGSRVRATYRRNAIAYLPVLCDVVGEGNHEPNGPYMLLLDRPRPEQADGLDSDGHPWSLFDAEQADGTWTVEPA